VTVKKLGAFYVTQHNQTMPHSAFQGETPDEMYFGRGAHASSSSVTTSWTPRRIQLSAVWRGTPNSGNRLGLLDFFTVEAVTWAGLVRFHVLFVIDLATRRVEIVGITDQPHEARMTQQARNLTGARRTRCALRARSRTTRNPRISFAFQPDRRSRSV
jgi:hypothetical protein